MTCDMRQVMTSGVRRATGIDTRHATCGGRRAVAARDTHRKPQCRKVAARVAECVSHVKPHPRREGRRRMSECLAAKSAKPGVARVLDVARAPSPLQGGQQQGRGGLATSEGMYE